MKWFMMLDQSYKWLLQFQHQVEKTLGSPACGDATFLLLTDDVAENTLSGSSLGGLAASAGIDAQVFGFFFSSNLISRAEGDFQMDSKTC